MARSTPSLLLTLIERNDPSLPLVVRLQASIRDLLLSGKAKPGDKLPASRQLAVELGMARDTVEAAYRHLETEGFLVRRLGSGTFVGNFETDLVGARPGGRRSALLRPDEVLSERGRAIARSGGVPDHPAPQPFVILPDVQAFPLPVWQRLVTRALKSTDPDVLLHADAQGYRPLRAEIVRYLAAHRGVQCDESQVLILSSSQQALSLIGMMMADVGQRIAVEDPCYHGARLALQAAGAALVPVPVDENGIDVAHLAEQGKDIRAVYVTPSHQYPLGVTLSLDRRLGLIEWARRNRAWIIEDDYDSEFRYDGRPISAIQGLDPSAPVLYVGTFSKVLFPSLRIAYLVLPESLLPAFIAARTLGDGHTTLVNQVALATFMQEGHFTAHIRRMRHLYAARREAFCAAFDQHLSPFGSYVTSAGGLHLAVHLKAGLTEAVTLRAAHRKNIELPTLSRMHIKRQNRQGWLMGFAALTPGEAAAAMAGLARALRSA